MATTPAQRKLLLLLVTGPQDTAELALALYSSRAQAGRAEQTAGRCVDAGYVERLTWDGRRWTYGLTTAGRAALQ